MSFSCRFALALAALSSLAAASAAPLPSSYSLADANLVVAVKNQGVLGTCWSFSSSTVFESSLIHAGFLTPEQASNYTSEWDMATHDGVKLFLTAPYAGWGAFPQQAISYYVRGFGSWGVKRQLDPAGGGPVIRANDPLDAYPLGAANQGLNLRPYVPPPNQPLAPFRLMQAVEFIDTQDGGGKAPSKAFRDTIKQAILRYGALDTNMNAANLGGPTNTENLTYDTYAYTGKSLSIDHDVTIIGWNDSVPVYDNTGNLLGTGAWLIQNSWGTDWSKSKKAVSKPDGCFWLGYCDTAAVKYSCAFVTNRRGSISTTVLQNQIFYFMDTQAGSPAGTPTIAATKLTPQSQTKLLAIGLWTVADHSAVNLSVYGAWGATGPMGAPLTSMKNVMIPRRGYSEIPLRAPLDLTTGKSIYVVVDFGSNVDAPVAVDSLSMHLKDVPSFAGLSWVSSDGRHWTDLTSDASSQGIFFLKGILGRQKYRAGGATLSVTRLSASKTSGTSVTLRGVASNNTDEVLWRLGKNGRIHRASGVNAWKIQVNGLQPGSNVITIWPTTAIGVSTTPTRVLVSRT